MVTVWETRRDQCLLTLNDILEEMGKWKTNPYETLED